MLNTVYRVFQPGRVRIDADLIVDIADLLLGDKEAAEEWRQACWVVAGLSSEAAIVSVASAWPADLLSFTGRDADLQKIVQPQGDPWTELAIWAISGMPGVGKTRLAVRAGHLSLSDRRFTGPQLAVDLRGYDPDRPPADPNAVLDGLLRRLGLSGDQILHLDVAARRAKLRQLLAGSGAMLLLDNAADADQVRPLLPTEPGCLVLITSRRALFELPSARHLSLDVLTPDEAIGVLRKAVGAGPVDAEPAVAADIAELLGRLPLALGLVASRIQGSPGWTLMDHLDRLQHHRRSLRLDGGVEIAISLSYRALPADQQRTFRLLALHPGNDITPAAAAALTGAAAAAAGRHLDQLTAASLLQCSEPGRFRFHDLIRTYAAGLVYDEDAAGERQAGLSRLCDQYLHTAGVAMDLIYPFERDRRPRVPLPAIPGPPLPDPVTARGWLDAEWANLLAVAGQSGGDVGAFAATLHRHLAVIGRYPDGQMLHQQAIAAAHRTGDRAGEAGALLDLAELAVRTGRYEQTIDHAQRALELTEGSDARSLEGRALRYLGLAHQFTGEYERAAVNHGRALAISRDIGDRIGEYSALDNLGEVAQRTGRYEQAAGYLWQALAVCDDLGSVEAKAHSLNGLGVLDRLAGRYGQAAERHRGALNLFVDVGDLEGQATAQDCLGVVCQLTDRYAQAAVHHDRALALSREIGDRDDEARALTYLGDLCRRTGEYARADDHYQAALVLTRDLGDPQGQAKVFNGLGEVARETGDPMRALAAHAEAHQHASKIGQRHEQARADRGLGHAHHDLGNAEQAWEHWRQALALYEELGVPEADEVRASLAALDN